MAPTQNQDPSTPRIPLLVIGGPTACGKTEAALRVAEALEGEIVSADSMQIYRSMDIGTAKPTPEERARAPIHLIDFVDPRDGYTVADFQRDARAAICGIHSRGRLPILCGGTGLYLRAVLGHLAFPPDPSQLEGIRRSLSREAERLGQAEMYRRLVEIDPDAAGRIEPNDTRRVLRALEVIEMTGRPFSAQQQIDATPGVDYNSACFVLTRPRERLYEGIERRVDDMQAIGYRHLMAHLAGETAYPETVRLIKRDTRRFAKRQLTWLRAERWGLPPGSGAPNSALWLEWSTTREFDEAVAAISQAAATWMSGRPH
jgi:tRNA dimethylallyltransferase